jgi:hypothetical protein
MIAFSVREKLEKILRLALCPAAPQGEWESAAYALIRTLRASGAKPEDVLSTRATAPTAVNSPIMRFGKYRGRAVRWIVESDPSYAEWVVRKVTNLSPSLRQEFRSDLKERYGDVQQKESK